LIQRAFRVLKSHWSKIKRGKAVKEMPKQRKNMKEKENCNKIYDMTFD